MSYTLFYESPEEKHNIDVARHSLGDILYFRDENYQPRQRIEFNENDIYMLEAMKETDWSERAKPIFTQIIDDIKKFGSVDVWFE